MILLYFWFMKSSFTIATLLMLLFACSPRPWQATNKVYKKKAGSYGRLIQQYPLKDSGTLFVGTVNFSMRRPNFVIIHHTAQNSCDETLKTFTTTTREVSAHYVICKTGTVYHMLSDMLRAQHAGVSRWGAVTDLNSCSIGIEIDNNGNESFTDEQIGSLLMLLKRLKQAYNIPAANFLGHADVAPGRKVDPSKYFPWEKLANEGFGIWYDTANVVPPPGFDALQALRTIGYNINKPGDAIHSYKLHFNSQDSIPTLTATDAKIITSLLEKYR